METKADFIIVGGGTAGCLLASRLANSKSHPSVILLEAGEDNTDPEYRASYNKMRLALEHPELDHGYISMPLKAYGDRQVPQIRGKGLGGSSQINFQVWSLGARDEFERWAEMVGDEGWCFDAVLKHVKEIERLHFEDLEVGHALLENLKPEPTNHGFQGEVDVSIGPVYEGELEHLFAVAKENGISMNADPNSGNLLGFGLPPTTSWKGKRTTSASAFLPADKRPSNLQILTKSRVTRIVLDDKLATAVETADGRTFVAQKEIILAAGAIDSPRLLLLSGVGPAADLEPLGIPVVNNIAGVGQSFTDHPASFMTYQMHDDMPYRPGVEQSKAGLDEPISSVPAAFLKHEQISSWPSFSRLPADVQDLLLTPTVPHFEFAFAPRFVFPFLPVDGAGKYFTIFVAVENAQARGHLTLSSSDPSVPAAIHPNYLGHEFDRQSLTETLRSAMQFMDTPMMRKYRQRDIFTPASSSADDIEAFINMSVASLWHPSGTLKMGPQHDAASVVGADLIVHGFDNLRVADLSVTPLLPSGHPQIVAYVIGAIAAEKIIENPILSLILNPILGLIITSKLTPKLNPEVTPKLTPELNPKLTPESLHRVVIFDTYLRRPRSRKTGLSRNEVRGQQRRTWNDFQVPAFSPNYQVITPFLRGYPPSAVPAGLANYTTDKYVTDLAAILQAESITRTTLIGHDVGGPIARSFAFALPDRVKSLVLTNAPFLPTFLPAIEFDAEQQALAEHTIPYHAYQPRQPKNVSVIVKNYCNTTYQRKIAEYLQASAIKGMLSFYNNASPGPPYGRTVSTAGLVQAVPTCIVWGDADPCFSNKLVDGLTPYAAVGIGLATMPGIGHWAFRDQPTRWNAELTSWLDLIDAVDFPSVTSEGD